MKTVRAHLVLLSLVLPLLTWPAAGQQIEVSEHTLDNGLKILIHEDHDVPNVALYFFYRIGSRNERPGTTGISHFFEHMMFNGAKKYGPKQFDIVMEKNGGANNAYTSRDLTVYMDWFPSSTMEVMFDLEADRIANLSFDEKIIESERGVVANERRLSVDNSNFGAIEEQMMAASYTAHPYGWPIIGWASDIEAWTMEDLKNHFRTGYAPNNCTMVVAGDVTPDEVLKLARKYLGPIAKQQPPPPVRTREPEQQGERHVELRRPAQLPMVLASFHVPESAHEDFHAIEVLGAILTSGRSSRLYRRLVDQDQLVMSVSHTYSLSLDPGEFYFSLRPRTGVEPAAAESALYEELDRLAEKGVTPREMEKAKNLLLVDLFDDLKTINGKANRLGQYELFFGDHKRLSTAGEELRKVTAPEVQQVAKKYFGAKNRTVATVIPDNEEGGE